MSNRGKKAAEIVRKQKRDEQLAKEKEQAKEQEKADDEEEEEAPPPARPDKRQRGEREEGEELTQLADDHHSGAEDHEEFDSNPHDSQRVSPSQGPPGSEAGVQCSGRVVGQVPPEYILARPAPPSNATQTKKLQWEREQAKKLEEGIITLTAKLKEMEDKVATTPQTVARHAGKRTARPSPAKIPVYKKDGEADQTSEPWKTIFPRAALFVFSELGPEALSFSDTKKDSAEIFRMVVEEEQGEDWFERHVIPKRDALLKQFAKKVQNDSQSHRRDAARVVNKLFCCELDHSYPPPPPLSSCVSVLTQMLGVGG
eukprot:1091774-Rhodomonas_salina.1